MKESPPQIDVGVADTISISSAIKAKYKASNTGKASNTWALWDRCECFLRALWAHSGSVVRYATQEQVGGTQERRRGRGNEVKGKRDQAARSAVDCTATGARTAGGRGGKGGSALYAAVE